MSKHEPCPPAAFQSASENPARVSAGGSKPDVARPRALGEIGFVGLGRMGAAMAANLAAKGRPVIAYVRRHYDARSVETPWQRRLVTGFG